jgi:cystathionine beta-lyase
MDSASSLNSSAAWAVASIEMDEETLRHADSAKWMTFPPDVLPLWVADMDYSIAPAVRQALVERLAHPVGYHLGGSDARLTSLLRAKVEQVGLTGLPEKKWVHFTIGVVQGLYAAVLALVEKGEEVVTMTPIYPPFLTAITDHGRVPKHVGLVESVEDGWRIDFAALEAAVSPSTRLLMLCHPHNPTGRLWTRDELAQIADIAERHQLHVVSDELHADLTLDGQFIPFASVASPALQQRTVTLTGPCKTYNTAGLGIGAMISHNPDLLGRLKRALAGIGGHPATLSIAMWRATLEDDGQWLAAVLQKIRDRRAQLTAFVRDHLPAVRFIPPQATYLAWLDYRAHPRVAAGEDIHKALLEEAKVALIPGPAFGPGYEGFLRLNFATSEPILAEALRRMASLER